MSKRKTISGASASTSGGSSSTGIGALGVSGGGSARAAVSPSQRTNAGKMTIDLTDPIGSIGSSLDSFGQYASPFVGGIAGEIGKVGFGDGKNIGAIADAPGNVLGAIGGIELPNASDGPAATVGDIPGKMLEVVGAFGKGLERTAAGVRVEAAKGGRMIDNLQAGKTGPDALSDNPLADATATALDIFNLANPLNILPNIAEALQGGDPTRSILPADLQERLDAGESVDVIADELVARGAGYSDNAGVNLVNQVLFDPLNLIAPGASKVGSGVKQAALAIDSAEKFREFGVGTRAAALAYSAASRGLNAGGAKMMDKMLGPTTSGVFFALGTKPYRTLTRNLGDLSSEYAAAFEDAFALGAAQMPRAVIARMMGDEMSLRLKGALDKVVKLGSPENVEDSIQARLFGARRYANNEIERRSEELLRRVVPTFDGVDPEVLRQQTITKLTRITGMTPEDAARAVGPTVDRKFAQTVHLAHYGRAGDDLAQAKAAAKLSGEGPAPRRDPRTIIDVEPEPVAPETGATPYRGNITGEAIDPAAAGAADDAPNIDIDRLTAVSYNTLTDELADDIMSGKITVQQAIERFDDLRAYFLNKEPSNEQVLDYVRELVDNGMVVEAVRLPRSGRNPLPAALSEWRQKYADEGYELGFAPKDGWKTVIKDGEVRYANPFVQFTSAADPVSMRNPLGRFMDSLFRGVTQDTIISESAQRMVDFGVRTKLPVSPTQWRAIHKAILEEAASRGMSPRALVNEKVMVGKGDERQQYKVFESIFRRMLSPEEFDTVTAQYDPAFLVMRAFEGNLGTVGATQKLTGMVKTAAPSWAGGIAERIYPEVRFARNPLFQLQEAIESPFWNGLRGVVERPVSDDIAAAYAQMSDLPEYRYLTEAGYFLHLAGDRNIVQFMGQNTRLGRRMAPFADVAARKEIRRVAQVMHEHGDDFQKAIQSINPRIWDAMVTAYGTSDPRVIAEKFLTERMKLTRDIDEAMGIFDGGAEGLVPDGTVLDEAGDVIVPYVKSGDAAYAPRPGWVDSENPMSEMVWQAFRDSFRQSTQRAFKTHYFNPQRGWFERTINHPYLGIYPASYMWGKVLPEFARFLIARPFGAKAPLVGLAATERVQQAYLGALAEDGDFQTFMEENADAIYVANLLVPGLPTNTPANTPAYSRHISEDIAAGRPPDVSTVVREAADSTSYAFGPLHSFTTAAKAAEDLGSIATDIFASLEKAAAEYDGIFGTP